MPQDGIAAALNVIDRTTTVGKRDYAMMLLAAAAGLRGVDMRELSLSPIEWGRGEIRIIQEKTGNASALPLTTDAGKAIREYIASGRPKSNSGKVFLIAFAPFGELRRGAPSSMLGRHCVKAGLTKKWGFHSLRRSIAANMAISGVSAMTAAQESGRRSINSTKQHISLDGENLEERALDFSGIRAGGGKR
ncbi:MAG: tyrosine-type recombinase/integrase [Clostridiales bacterium]|jgi:integrase|nr:tyrosine-type recombinase/integrase [Clostridiales bacterium]